MLARSCVQTIRSTLPSHLPLIVSDEIRRSGDQRWFPLPGQVPADTMLAWLCTTCMGYLKGAFCHCSWGCRCASTVEDDILFASAPLLPCLLYTSDAADE